MAAPVAASCIDGRADVCMVVVCWVDVVTSEIVEIFLLRLAFLQQEQTACFQRANSCDEEAMR